MMQLNFFLNVSVHFFLLLSFDEKISHFINKKIKWSWWYTEFVFTRIFSPFLNFLQYNFYHFPSFFWTSHFIFNLLLLFFLALSSIFSIIFLIYFAITTPFPTSFPSSLPTSFPTSFLSSFPISFPFSFPFPISFPISFAAYTPAVVLPLFLPFLYFALPLLFLLGNILDDTVLIETLAQSKNTSEDINEKLREASLITIEISVQSELYRPVAKRWVEYSYL